MLPTAIALLAQAYPPGRNRNLAFGLFGKHWSTGTYTTFLLKLQQVR